MKATIIDFDIMNDCVVDCSVDFDINKKNNKKIKDDEMSKKEPDLIPRTDVVEQKINFR